MFKWEVGEVSELMQRDSYRFIFTLLFYTVENYVDSCKVGIQASLLESSEHFSFLFILVNGANDKTNTECEIWGLNQAKRAWQGARL